MSGDDTTGLSKPFGVQSIAKAVHDTLSDAFAAIPDGKNNAFIVDGSYDRVTGARMRGMVVHRTADGWSTMLEGDVDKAHGLAGKVAIAKAW